ncbi:MAG: hypothetical protein ACC656_05320 [Candidatus Heimdallarchaeota archaeon]
MKNIAISIFIMLIMIFVQPVSLNNSNNVKLGDTDYIETPMDLNIILSGIDSSFLDTNKLNEFLMGELLGVPYKSESVLIDISGIGTLSRVYWKYNFIFTSSAFDDNLNSTAFSAGIEDNVKNKTGLYIDTNSMRNFINNSVNVDFQIPENGYTLFLANLSSLGDHWYQTFYQEIDTNQQVNRSFLNSFSVDRLFFIDLSVQESYLELFGSNGPIQDLATKSWIGPFGSNGPIQDLVAKYSPNDAHGNYMITNYFGDWIIEAIYDLFYPNPVYSPPNFYETWDADNLDAIRDLAPGSNKNIDIYLMNNITGNVSTDFTPYISTTVIRDSFSDLLPWYNWNVNTIEKEVDDFPSLSKKLREFTDLTKNGTFEGRKKGAVDLFSLYDWMFYEIFTGNSTTTLPFLTFQKGSLPVFIFTFDAGVFGIPYKTNFRDGILGASFFQGVPLVLGASKWSPLMLLTYDYENFAHTNKSRNNYGFTNLIIHELGHSVSLPHPHGFSWATSMLEDPMSYITYTYEFSVFSKDHA